MCGEFPQRICKVLHCQLYWIVCVWDTCMCVCFGIWFCSSTCTCMILSLSTFSSSTFNFQLSSSLQFDRENRQIGECKVKTSNIQRQNLRNKNFNCTAEMSEVWLIFAHELQPTPECSNVSPEGVMSRVDWRGGFLENSLNFLECQEAKGVTWGCDRIDDDEAFYHKRACSWKV